MLNSRLAPELSDPPWHAFVLLRGKDSSVILKLTFLRGVRPAPGNHPPRLGCGFW